MPSPRSPKLNLISLAILELLDERNMHPYEMQQTLRDRGRDRLVKLTVGSLYHAVERLEKFRLIEAVDTSRQGRLPERTVYSITADGRAAFTDRLREMVSTPAPEYLEFPLALAFLHVLGREEAIEWLTWRAAMLEAEIAAEETVAARLTGFGTEELYFLDLTWQTAAARAQLEWIRTVVERLASGALPWPSEAAGRQQELKLPEPGQPVHGPAADDTGSEAG
ncbi:PadR family transcriptional regulator [Streptomyces albofaciens]|uniref:PadR family transcriptional regulator n=1 Tax=Streptomyces albofaciens TaxID=66866 RepID=UPI001239A888|nr:PadR family transcriptional regulator [Streptomyces albofaciens]